MNITTILAKKKEDSLALKKTLGLLLKFKPLWLIKLSDSKLTNDLVNGLKSLPAGFVVYLKDSKTEILSNNVVVTWKLDNWVLSGFDFIVCDNKIKDIDLYIKKWITPIILRENTVSSNLIEFNPLKNEWNSFFYENCNQWDIFYSIVRYMENYKFPFDNKNLVSNVLKV